MRIAQTQNEWIAVKGGNVDCFTFSAVFITFIVISRGTNQGDLELRLAYYETFCKRYNMFITTKPLKAFISADFCDYFVINEA